VYILSIVVHLEFSWQLFIFSSHFLVSALPRFF